MRYHLDSADVAEKADGGKAEIDEKGRGEWL